MSATDYSLERGLPVSMDAERAILAAILLDNSLYDQASERLTGEEFSLDAHRRIYGRIRDLQESGRPVDMVTLMEELDRHKEVDSIGGIAYLSSLIDGVPERPSIEQYVDIVRNKALLRGLINISQNSIAEAIEHSDDPREVLARTEQAIYQLSESAVSQKFSTMSDVAKSVGSIDDLCARGREISGLATNLIAFDALTGGLQNSNLIIIAARPSMGKTALAMNIADFAAIEHDKAIGIFSLEMSREELYLRMLSSRSRVDSKNIRTGFLTKEDRFKLQYAMEKLVPSKIFVDDSANLSISEMRAKAKRLHAKENLSLVIVDYLQLMSAGLSSGKRYDGRVQEVSQISRGLKALAKELCLPVVALCQLNRDCEKRPDKRPQLSDLRESGSIEQDADVVAFIFREEVYKKDDPDLEGIAELIIAKQRNGPTDTVKLAFLKRSTRFENLDASN